jgi:uncharacterized damage-inducible protein DinB
LPASPLLPEYFATLYEYNRWANLRCLEVAGRLPAEALHRKQDHSWGSVHGVLVHMLSAEWIWLTRWQGESPGGMLKPDDYPDIESVARRWEAVDRELRIFAAAQTPASLGAIVKYNNTHGQAFALPLWQLMAHCANHATHHRGELAAMFARLNIAHPEDDLYGYFLAQGGSSKK